ncbi:hypothetical protein [Lignipirellula cremea]|uniref:hypothetical protein n=1 Tax=Lignipirellula cremea TaxID=2528010 RepID=UPI00119FC2EA|nr:hypothetical protein [Lignipirellula cremea]
MTLDITQSEIPRAVDIKIQGRLFFQIRYNEEGNFIFGESENGIRASGAQAASAPMEIHMLNRRDVLQRLLDIGMDVAAIEANIQWLAQANAT